MAADPGHRGVERQRSTGDEDGNGAVESAAAECRAAPPILDGAIEKGHDREQIQIPAEAKAIASPEQRQACKADVEHGDIASSPLRDDHSISSQASPTSGSRADRRDRKPAP